MPAGMRGVELLNCYHCFEQAADDTIVGPCVEQGGKGGTGDSLPAWRQHRIPDPFSRVAFERQIGFDPVGIDAGDFAQQVSILGLKEIDPLYATLPL